MIGCFLRKHDSGWLEWPVCRHSNDCANVVGVDSISDLVPKKRNGQLLRHIGIEGFGIKILIGLSWWRVAVGFVIWMLVSAIFIVCWLNAHDGALQDAFVPATILLAVFAIYLNLVSRLWS